MNSFEPILYLEDDEKDVLLMTEAFSRLKLANPLRSVPNVVLMIAYLKGYPPFECRLEYPLPRLLLLDLSMPGCPSLDFLKWVKNDPAHSTLPVIILGSSREESDIHRAYLLGASGYFIKPGNLDELVKIVKSIQKFWLSDPPSSGTFIDFAAVPVMASSSGRTADHSVAGQQSPF